MIVPVFEDEPTVHVCPKLNVDKYVVASEPLRKTWADCPFKAGEADAVVMLAMILYF